MQQAKDFLAESEALEQLIAPLQTSDFSQSTGFKSWTFETILRHLHFWNHMAHLSLSAPEAFQGELQPAVEGMMAGQTLPEIEAKRFPEAGAELRALWQTGFRQVHDAFSEADPSERLAWVGPSMSARSSITARQMETWAHGQAISDELGVVREEADRIHNIVILGVNTFGWSFKVRGMEIPEDTPYLQLTSPSGALWEFGEPQAINRISGQAHEFAQVVTQTRHIDDTALLVEGDIAALWMAHAQCFAGAAATPPAPGTRRVKG